MKTKFPLFFSLMLLLGLFSCRKEMGSPTQLNEEKIDANALAEVRSFTSEKSVKLAYATLNAYEQEALWRGNIEHYINNGGLSHVQIGYLNKLLSKLTPEMFEKKDAITIAFAHSWVKNALSAFTEPQLVLMLGNLKQSTKEQLSAVGINKAAKTSECDPVICPEPLEWDPTVCMCVQPTGEVPWCTCKSSNTVFTMCTAENEKCTDLIPMCRRINFCGFLYLEDCDGRCKIVAS